MYSHRSVTANNRKNILVLSSLFLLKLYKLLILPSIPHLIGIKPECRFSPTCSEYMAQSLQAHGVRGFVMGAKQLASCHRI